MSKRRILSKDKVGESFYAKLEKLRIAKNQNLVVKLFKDLETRRKCYKLSEFEFKPHATEYIFPGFFKTLTLAGRTRLIPLEEAEQIKFIKTLVAISKALGLKEDYDSMTDRLESVSEANLSNNKLIEIIPELLYAYTAVHSDTLILKLEYYFGAQVIDTLDVHGCAINTGRARVYQDRAKQHASSYLEGMTVTQQRKSLKSEAESESTT